MSDGRRVAVIFHYYEANPIYRDNLIFFLATAHRPELDFHVVLSSDCSVALPTAANIRIVRAPNRNNDYGGYCCALDGIGDLDAYSHYVFVNSSVRGPFLPGPLAGRDWTELFTDLMTPDVGLVGSTICMMSEAAAVHAIHRRLYPEATHPMTHVQTTAYALPRAVLRHLWDNGFYSHREPMPKGEVISRYEVRLSQQVMEGGWNLRCLQPEYNAVDYRLPQPDPNGTSSTGDPLYDGAFFGRTLHPREAVFIKTNRDLLTDVELASHTYAALRFGPRTALSDWAEARDLLRRTEAAVPRDRSSHDRRLSPREWMLVRTIRALRGRLRDSPSKWLSSTEQA